MCLFRCENLSANATIGCKRTPPSLPIYIFSMREKASDKLRIVCECLTKMKSGCQGAKKLVIDKHKIFGMIERFRYLTTVTRMTHCGQLYMTFSHVNDVSTHVDPGANKLPPPMFVPFSLLAAIVKT